MNNQLQQASGSRSGPSSSLWGHFLHKKAQSPTATKHTLSTVDGPPLVPTDKTGISARILLHDTQASIEAFSAQVGKLIGEAENSRKEVTKCQKVFQHGQEKLLEQQVELVNRAQTQIQKSLGKPSQAEHTDTIRKAIQTVDNKVDALDRRIDALYMLSQTHVQALQTIQDQQGRLITMLTPLHPLVQAIPLHIDVAKNDVKDVVREVKDLTCTLRNESTALKGELQEAIVGALRRLSPQRPVYRPPPSPESSPSQGLPRKRRRVQDTPGKPVPVSGPRTRPQSAQSSRNIVPTSASRPSSSVACLRGPGSPSSDLSAKDDSLDPLSVLRLSFSNSMQPSPSRPATELSRPISPFAFPIVSSLPSQASPARAARLKASLSLSASSTKALADSQLPEPLVSASMGVIATVTTIKAASEQTPTAKEAPDDGQLWGTDASWHHSSGNDSLDQLATPPSPALNCIDSPAFEMSIADVTMSNAPDDVSKSPSHVVIASEDSTQPQEFSSSGSAKPMSLKDRRARGLLTGLTVGGERKRVIAIDLDEIEDDSGVDDDFLVL